MQKNGFLTSAFLAFSFVGTAIAQGPVGDTVMVNFDRPVQVGSYTLGPGEYTVRQITSASNPRVLEFTSDHGTRLEATVTAIPIMQNTPPGETEVILQDEGGGARLHRIWVQGKTYGYEIPGQVAAAPRPSTLNLQARFDAAPAPVVAQAAPPPPAREEPPADAQTRLPEPPKSEPQQIAEATPPPAPPEPPPPPPAVPATALGWANLLLVGLSVATAGLFLYRRAA
jgi:hypothetical protein